MKNSSDTIGNRTRDLPTCSAVPQPTVLPRAPNQQWHFPNSNLLACCARCGHYTVAGINYTATLNIVAREMRKELNFDRQT